MESAPQLATQWYLLLRSYNGPQQIHTIQIVSMVTSTLALAAAIVNFIAMKRKKLFICHQLPTAASLVPIT